MRLLVALQVSNVGLFAFAVRQDGIVMENVLICIEELFLLKSSLPKFLIGVIVGVDGRVLLRRHLSHLVFKFLDLNGLAVRRLVKVMRDQAFYCF